MGGMTASMNCLVCGHKLAIFRKLSLGDFCSQEHRALFIREQSDRGLARLMETNGETRSRASGTRVYAQFLLDELPASQAGPGSLGYGPLAPIRSLAPQAPLMSFARLAPARHTGCIMDELPASQAGSGSLGYGPLAPIVSLAPEAPPMSFARLAPARHTEYIEPRPGSTAPLGYGMAGLSLRLPGAGSLVWSNGSSNTHLRPAGLILPWSTGAASHSVFSLAPLAAAAWAQSGFCKPIAAHNRPLGAVQFAWPNPGASLELPSSAIETAPAAIVPLAARSSQSMRVRLATPLLRQKPKLELTMPGPAAETEPAAIPTPSAPRNNPLSNLFKPRLRPPVTTRSRTRLDRDEVFSYNEPVQPRRSSPQGPWMSMLAAWSPSAAGVSSLFAVLFLFSAATIFLSAPSTMSYRTPSFRWGNLRSAIRNRAVLMVEDDFRSGLNGWSFPSGKSQDWSYDQAGFLRPGKLGFLQDSMKLTNYRLELMGQIERKSLGWAFRAKDENNYYVAKLTISRPGPLPMVDLIHYPVTNGREGAKIRVALPFAVRNDTLYQVEMIVRDNQYRASVNGHMVDAWSDTSLVAGGVGFVTGKGEASRVRWIRVSDRDDVLGRVCSFLSARSYQPSSEPVLSASYYTILWHPGL